MDGVGSLESWVDDERCDQSGVSGEGEWCGELW